MLRRVGCICLGFVLGVISLQAGEVNYYEEAPFGGKTGPAGNCDNMAIGNWYDTTLNEKRVQGEWFKTITRDEAMAFALYTHDHGVLKLTGQCFPLLPDEPKSVVLEFKRGEQWEVAAEEAIQYPGWSVHFRIEGWDNTRDVPYRLRLGEVSHLEGLIRKDPVEKDAIVVALLSCNSPNDKEFDSRASIVNNLKAHDPDLLFFAGDQNYTHDEATYGWLQFGVQFRDVMKDRPTICIPDDHDVGHGNLWGAGGKVSTGPGASDGGYRYPASFVNMVERQQTWNLPDPFDPTPIQQGIGVYYTDLNVGGVSFAILEDRKFKSPPQGNIPQMGPRPDHINNPSYDRNSVDVSGLTLLGERQLKFLDTWNRDWTGADLKVVLSQSAFCGAVHIHGSENNRLLADLDCNGWPQTPRNEAVRAIRRARATHLCGDQHLAVTVQHGIDAYRDGPYAFTGPAIVNTIYGRWWHPEDEKSGGGDPLDAPLPWVGDYEDGLGNKITMLAYANPENRQKRETRGGGYGLVRLHKESGKTVFECWPRFGDVTATDAKQYLGWPIQFHAKDNDGRAPAGYLKEVDLPVEDAVVELTNDETGELIYCYRVQGKTFKAPVYSHARHTLKAGENRADVELLKATLPNK